MLVLMIYTFTKDAHYFVHDMHHLITFHKSTKTWLRLSDFFHAPAT